MTILGGQRLRARDAHNYTSLSCQDGAMGQEHKMPCHHSCIGDSKGGWKDNVGFCCIIKAGPTLSFITLLYFLSRFSSSDEQSG